MSALRGSNGRENEAGAEMTRQLRQQAGTQPRHETFIRDTRGVQLVAPQLRVASLCLRQLQKEVLAQRISFRGGERRVELGAIELVAEIFPIALDVGLHTLGYSHELCCWVLACARGVAREFP